MLKQSLNNRGTIKLLRAQTLYMANPRRGFLLKKNRVYKYDKSVYLGVFGREATASNILRGLSQHRGIMNGYIEI